MWVDFLDSLHEWQNSWYKEKKCDNKDWDFNYYKHPLPRVSGILESSTLPHLLVLATSERFLPTWHTCKAIFSQWEPLVATMLVLSVHWWPNTNRCGEGISDIVGVEITECRVVSVIFQGRYWMELNAERGGWDSWRRKPYDTGAELYYDLQQCLVINVEPWCPHRASDTTGPCAHVHALQASIHQQHSSVLLLLLI